MSFGSKIVVGSVLGVSAIAGWSYLNNLKRAATELQVVAKASIYQLSWQGVTIRLDVILKNPTKASFSLKFPFVELLYKDSVIGSSQAVDKEIRLPAYGEAAINNIMIQIPMTSAFSVVFTIIKSLFANEAVAVSVKTATTINLGWITLPYETKQELTIKK